MEKVVNTCYEYSKGKNSWTVKSKLPFDTSANGWRDEDVEVDIFDMLNEHWVNGEGMLRILTAKYYNEIYITWKWNYIFYFYISIYNITFSIDNRWRNR